MKGKLAPLELFLSFIQTRPSYRLDCSVDWGTIPTVDTEPDDAIRAGTDNLDELEIAFIDEARSRSGRGVGLRRTGFVDGRHISGL